MSNHEHNNTDQAGRVIEEIARREQEMEALLKEAQAQADSILNEARVRADQLLKSTREDLLKQAEQQKNIRAGRTKEIRDKQMALAEKEAAVLEQKAAEHRKQAVDLVIKQILPEEL